MGREDVTVAEAHRVLALLPDHEVAGIALRLDLGTVEEARACFREVATVDPLKSYRAATTILDRLGIEHG